MRAAKNWFGILLVLMCSACSGGNENAHTTATTFVSPPPRQVLKAEIRPAQLILRKPDPKLQKPLLVFYLPNGATFREGDAVVIEFLLENADLKGDGGEYRLRYIVDDDEMQWIDHWEQVRLTGWVEGKHTIRLELVGPDGWPAKNGDNIFTREITITK